MCCMYVFDDLIQSDRRSYTLLEASPVYPVALY